MAQLLSKSSINIQPCKHTSESHNLRLRKFSYVNHELTKNNFNWGFDEIKLQTARRQIAKLSKEITGRQLQAIATPLREGVFLIDESHTNEQILSVVQGVQAKFGIKAIQLSVHRDEGRKQEDGTWKLNLHAHVVFDWQDKSTGKMFRLNKEKMSDLQTYFAEGLNMTRGKKSDIRHLNALEFKAIAEEKRLAALEEEIKKKTNLSSNLSQRLRLLEKIEEKQKNRLSQSETILNFVKEVREMKPNQNLPLETLKKKPQPQVSEEEESLLKSNDLPQELTNLKKPTDKLKPNKPINYFAPKKPIENEEEEKEQKRGLRR